MLGLVARTVPYLSGLLRGKKAVNALLAAKKATDAAKGAASAGAASRAGIRKAADFLIGKDLVDRPGQLALRLGPDAAFAGLNAYMTPGDLVDKAVTFGTDFGLSGLTGLEAGRIARHMKAGEGAQIAADQIGSIGGALLSMPATDSLLRLKDPDNLNPYDRMALENQRMMEEQLRAQIMREYGLTADSGADPFLVSNGLGA